MSLISYSFFHKKTAALRKRFLDTIQRYQDVERNYQLKYRQRIERQIRIGKQQRRELKNGIRSVTPIIS